MLPIGQTRNERRRAADAFEREALPHAAALKSYALRLASGDEARAEELVQETLFRAFRAWRSYVEGTNCRAWLMTILRNLVYADHASARRTRQLGHLAVESGALPSVESRDPEREFFDRLVDDRVVTAIASLPTLSRQAVVLKDIQGLRYSDIARQLGVPVGTVKSRLFRARQALQGQLLDYAISSGYVRQEATMEDAVELDLAA